MGYELYTGCCTHFLQTYLDECIHLTVTSPPYDNLRKAYDGLTSNVFELLVKELYRVTVTGGVVVWVVSDATIKGSETGTSFKQALCFMSNGFNLHDTMIYKKSTSTWNISSKRYRNNFEYMFVFSKGKPRVFNPIRDVEIKDKRPRKIAEYRDKNKDGVRNYAMYYPKHTHTVRGNIWTYSPGGVKTNHPATFPLRLAKEHITSWSNEGDTVLDPFMGSGTTGHAAIELGRKFIGIDIEPSYVALANKRLMEIQHGLFE